jgi:hypothetical protein
LHSGLGVVSLRREPLGKAVVGIPRRRVIRDVLAEDCNRLVHLPGSEQFVSLRVDVSFGRKRERFLPEGGSGCRITLGFYHQRFCAQRLIVAVHADGTIGPRLRAIQIGLVARAPRGRLREPLPEEAG